MPAAGILVDGMPVGSAHITQAVDSRYADGPLSGGITAGGLTFPGIGRQAGTTGQRGKGKGPS